MFGNVNIFDKRKNRGIVQKLYLVEILEASDDLKREYIVMGSTGNVYRVEISETPTCTCPDYVQRKCRCKHIYFILLRIMKISKEMEDKQKYSNDELVTMFQNIPNITNNLIVGENIKKIYIKKKNPELLKKSKDDLCPICIDDLENGEDLDFCKGSCGKYIHVECFSMWCKSRGIKTCVYCRANWIKESDYINLTNI
mgnify:CR=1 FL=1